MEEKTTNGVAMKDYIIPIGPQHPALKESMCIRVVLEGNYIQDVKIRMGYMHKGIENILEGKNPDSAIYIAQRICGICSSAHENAYTRTVEGIMNFKPERKVRLLRALMMELERISSHLIWLGIIFHEIGFETLFMYFWRERERILDIFEKLTGGRVHHNFNKLKTVRYDLEDSDRRFILRNLNLVEKKVNSYLEDVKSDRIIKSRLRDVGIITRSDAKKFCLVGPNARASNVSCDIRKFDPPYGIYEEFEFEEILGDYGDSFERTMVRIREIIESIKIIKQILKVLPKRKLPKPTLTYIKDGKGFGRVEAPRGELFYFLKIKNNLIERAKIRTPTFASFKIVEKILLNHRIGDVPVIVGSLDPCFSCLERVMIVKNGKVELLNEEQFRRKYVCTK
jgi:NADH-quinone oxidoreductase subunit D